MKLNDILHDYVNNGGEKHGPRQPGRYWASEIHAIVKGYCKPEDFFAKGEIDMLGVGRILTGVANEDLLTKILVDRGVKFEGQVKKELEIEEGIILVVKPDFVFPDFVLETKFPFRDEDGIPERYMYQLEAEHRAFDMPVMLGKFRVPFDVEFHEFRPSSLRWDKAKKAIVEFHRRVLAIGEKLTAEGKAN